MTGTTSAISAAISSHLLPRGSPAAPTAVGSAASTISSGGPSRSSTLRHGRFAGCILLPQRGLDVLADLGDELGAARALQVGGGSFQASQVVVDEPVGLHGGHRLSFRVRIASTESRNRLHSLLKSASAIRPASVSS